MPHSSTDALTHCDALTAHVAAYRPLPPSTLAQLRRYYRLGLTYTSNALEGNTLTETETKVVLEDGLTIGGKPLAHHLEAHGHAQAVDYLLSLASQTTVTQADVLALHALVMTGARDAHPGHYRNQPVIITGTTYLPPQPDALPALMQALFTDTLPHWQATKHPLHTAALAHLELVAIHPFADGNGRTARLLMNVLLHQAGYALTPIPLIHRAEYVACLRAATEANNPTPFLAFITDCVTQATHNLLRLLKHLHPSD
jgi:Fic family protein